MKKGLVKGLILLVGGGLLIQGCVSAGAHRKLKDKYNTDVTTLDQHAKSLGMANQELDQNNQKLGFELKLAQANIDKLSMEDRNKAETILRLKESIIKKLQGLGEGFELTPTGGEMKGDFLFSPGGAEIKSSAKETLNKLAEIIKSEPGQYIRIDSHTDTDPISRTKDRWTTGSNFELAAYRALSVLLYLEEQGVDSSRMFLCSFGQHRPKGAKKSENRRVSISFIPIGGAESGESKPESGGITK
ncbi:MAG: OmpA family protein [Planctomycetes bacterium]|nr:OmpA family protein [Planctomycetota bacterium]